MRSVMRFLERYMPRPILSLMAVIYYYVLPTLNPIAYYRYIQLEMEKRQKTHHKISQIRQACQQLPSVATTIPRSGTGPLFTLLPVEIRRQILIEAFGRQTVHLDLDFDGKDTQSGSLRWSSCVCHSSNLGLCHKLRYNDFFKRGRPRTVERRSPLHCPSHYKASASHSEPYPEECSVGASGWLLSCHQAYAEGIEILYRTNRIHIDSEILLKGIQDILPPEKLNLISSLEITMSSHDAYMDSFTGALPDSVPNSPSFPFPSLLQLHIMNPDSPYFIVPYCVNRFVERLVPTNTVITVSYNNWWDYSTADLQLLEHQGQERTQMQVADIGGLKCWREIKINSVKAKVSQTAESVAINSKTAPAAKRGYWIHIAEKHVDYSDIRKLISP